ncbi:CDP-archaeol synthase [Desulfocurvibacter africanus]|uniref:CDP-archaeol synthase n=1 Tax=Desulfocurvibacter africanus TaxID=873 RepID=UPI000424AEAC|nr:CDP-archaeol synthase [Desulfocurvibacter africanus]
MDQLVLGAKSLALLLFVNFVPPALALKLRRRWDRPLDLGRRFMDGRPLLGPHKTVRGLAGSVLGGGLGGLLLGLPLWLGLATGLASMAGDLLTSFIKRRLDKSSGQDVPGLDQFLEGFLAVIVLAHALPLGPVVSTLVLAGFCLAAYYSSAWYKNVFYSRPRPGYPRPFHPRTRWREYRCCRLSSRPLMYLFNLKEGLLYNGFITSVFHLAGLTPHGRRNALEVGLTSIAPTLPGLPLAFGGYRILFATDLHLDGLDGLDERLRALVRDERFDLCLLGGDLRYGTFGNFGPALDRLARVLARVQARDGVLAVMGNHDCLEIVGPLRDMGVQVLLNEAWPITRGRHRLWIAGVDDPHAYRCADPRAAMQDVPPDETAIMLAHSPEAAVEASALGAALYLCGHTHGGQISLPRIGPVVTNMRGPRSMAAGLWSLDGMVGYTSTGAGVSGAPVRFGTRGEIVSVTLRREEPVIQKDDVA